jgi:membrane-anchored protein YejM (alkaline phosphatase superfamily)
MTAPLIPTLWLSFIGNLLLQVYDGAFTYYLLTLGVSELNPLVNDAIQMWGAAWGLIYWKVLACVLIVLVFALRHRRSALARRALTLTAMVYGCLAIIGFFEVILGLGI